VRWLEVAAASLLGLGTLAVLSPVTWPYAVAPRRLKERHCGEEQVPPPEGQCEVTILHISDTHNLHRSMAKDFPMPRADILLHTGDISDHGDDAEIADFNEWLGEIKHHYKYGVLLISGNHDWMSQLGRVQAWQTEPEVLLHPKLLQDKVPNARVLHHELVEVAGVRIFGSDWCPWFGYAAPGDWWNMEWTQARQRVFAAWKQQALRNGSSDPVPTHRYGEIPGGVDILMSHMAPWDIFDQTLYGQWGSSKDLRSNLEATRPKVHLFGHIHENRGSWQRWSPSKAYMGGVEYEPVPGKKFGPRPPPNATYPSDLILNNAQMNNQFLDQTYTHSWGPVQIKAPGKLITAKWSGGQWHFSAERCDSAASRVSS